MHNSEARCAQKFRFTRPGLQVRVGQAAVARSTKAMIAFAVEIRASTEVH